MIREIEDAIIDKIKEVGIEKVESLKGDVMKVVEKNKVFPVVYVQYSGSTQKHGAGEQYHRLLNFTILIADRSIRLEAKDNIYQYLDLLMKTFGYLIMENIGIVSIKGDSPVLLENGLVVWGLEIQIERWWRHE